MAFGGTRDHYQSEGWVVPRFALAPPRVLVRDALDQLLRHPGACPRRCRRTSKATTAKASRRRHSRLARDPEIVDLVSGVIGDDVILWGCHVFCKPAGEGFETPWHQDGHYWPIRPLANCTVWVALEESTTENGCLRVIPRSHAGKHLHEHLHEDRTDLTLTSVWRHVR
jgi:hypothetical protein